MWIAFVIPSGFSRICGTILCLGASACCPMALKCSPGVTVRQCPYMEPEIRRQLEPEELELMKPGAGSSPTITPAAPGTPID